MTEVYFLCDFRSIALRMGLAASKQESFWEACGFGHVHRVRKFLSQGDIDVNWVSYTVSSSCILREHIFISRRLVTSLFNVWMGTLVSLEQY